MWPEFADINSSLCEQDCSLEIKWWQYDSVFVIWPINCNSIGEQFPRGDYQPEHSRGTTYATISDNYFGNPNTSEVILHEWLHGVCSFFSGFGWAIPDKQYDGAGYYGYTQDKDSWNEFYKDLMRGQVKDKRLSDILVGGILPEIWHSGTPLNPGSLIGIRSTDPTKFQSYWNENKLNGYFDIAINDYCKSVNNSEEQNFNSENGKFRMQNINNDITILKLT